VDRSRLAIKIGLGAAVVIALSFGMSKLINASRPGFGFMRNAEVVYTGRHSLGKNNAETTDTVANIPESWTDAVRHIEGELPQAIRRQDSEGSISYVVPQFENGRMQIDEYPEQLIKVRPGRVVNNGSKLVVMNDSVKNWSHIEIEDFRGPSALESAFNWLGNRMGI